MRRPATTSPLHLLAVAVGVLIVVGLAVHFAHTLFGFASPERDFLIEEWVYGFITTGAALAVLARAALRRDERWAWGLIGGGLLLWAFSDLYWAVELAKLDEIPFPNTTDITYLGGYALVFAGVAVLAQGRIRQMSLPVWVDVAIAALGVAAIGTAVLMDYVVEHTTGTTLEVAVAVAYPVLDLAILTVALASVVLTGWRPGRAIGLVSIGIVCTAIGDAVFTYQTLAGTYDATAWNNSLWPLGVVLIAAAALQPPAPRRELPSPESWRSFASPAVFALAILVLLVLSGGTGADTALVGTLTIATLAAIVIRLALTFRENRRLVSALQRDALTGLGNRSKLLVDLRSALHADPDEPHVLAMLDLDGFKAYNDAFGHPAGDAVLLRLGGKLNAAAEEGGGFAYRLGGDEFALLIRGDTASSAATVATAATSLTERGEGFKIGASVGCVEVPSEASDPSNALQLADQRMYADKDSHRPSPGGEVEAVLLRILHQRSQELAAHGRKVANLATAVAEKLALPDGERAAIRRAGEIHDIGKIAIPDSILQKPGPLNDEEWEFIRQHTILGERILAEAPSLAAVGKIVRSHHECWDGKGYPDGLEGATIPLAARIIFVCDAYDAMTSPRPYRARRRHEEALAELRGCAGTMFDSHVVDVFCELAETGRLPLEGEPAREPARRS